MRARAALAWSALIFELLSGHGLCQTGITSRGRKNHVAVTWAGPEVPEGQVGVLLEKDQAVGIFVVDPPGKKQTTVKVLDAWTQGVVARNRALKLLDLRKPAPESEKVSLLVWALHSSSSRTPSSARTRRLSTDSSGSMCREDRGSISAFHL